MSIRPLRLSLETSLSLLDRWTPDLDRVHWMWGKLLERSTQGWPTDSFQGHYLEEAVPWPPVASAEKPGYPPSQ